jgi:hypothetical protein
MQLVLHVPLSVALGFLLHLESSSRRQKRTGLTCTNLAFLACNRCSHYQHQCTQYQHPDLVQVMCLAVPIEVKASIFGFLAANVASAAEAVQLLNRLEAAELVHSNRLGTNLATQLTNVAESEEEYSDMISYVHMINSICETAGPLLVVEEQERLFPYTVRCRHACVPLAVYRAVYSRPEQHGQPVGLAKWYVSARMYRYILDENGIIHIICG